MLCYLTLIIPKKLQSFVPVKFQGTIDSDISVYWSSLTKVNDKIYTKGGRVLSMVSYSPNSI